MSQINICLRIENCSHKNRHNFPVDLILPVKAQNLAGLVQINAELLLILETSKYGGT